MDKLVVLLPQLGPAVKALALKETGFSVDDAVRMLEMFQAQNQERLGVILKVGRRCCARATGASSAGPGAAERDA